MAGNSACVVGTTRAGGESGTKQAAPVYVRGPMKRDVTQLVTSVLQCFLAKVMCQGSVAVLDTAGGNNCVRKGRIECYSGIGGNTGVTVPETLGESKGLGQRPYWMRRRVT